MKCSICSAEIESGVVVCPACGAIKLVERTPLGVLVGWVGIVATTLTAMMVIPLPLLMFLDISWSAFPWILLVLGAGLAAGSFWYSNGTKRTVWHPRGQ